jgi:hypothetical protein
VVFACIRNGGRSVIARVLTEHYAGVGSPRSRRAPSRASTSTPKSPTPYTLGLDTTGEHPQPLTRETVAASELAIIPRLPGTSGSDIAGVTYRDWPIDDPRGQDPATVRGSWPTSTPGSAPW